jgi:hypothetical protein
MLQEFRKTRQDIDELLRAIEHGPPPETEKRAGRKE